MPKKIVELSNVGKTVHDFSRYNVSIISTGESVIRCKGSFETVDFTTSASGTNPWSYVGMVNLESGEFIEGNTGLVTTGPGVHLMAINAEDLDQIAFEVTGANATIRSYLS